MSDNCYRIESFLLPEEAYHYARGPLPSARGVQLHSHDYYEVFLVEEGQAVQYLPDSSQTLVPGDVVFVRPPHRHALAAAGEAPCIGINVLFRKDTADHLVTRYVDDLEGRYFWTEADEPARARLGPEQLTRALEAAKALATGSRSLARLEEFLLYLTAGLIGLPKGADGALPDWLAEAYVAAHRPEVFRDGAAGFVRAAGRGHEHVCRKTRAHLGVTPSALINRIRMEHAAVLLTDAEMSVSDVADECGIENMSHFYRVFRQHYGVTPKAFRVQHRKSPF